MFTNSIRWRLQVWHGLILLTVLTGFGFTAYHLARQNQLRRIDEDLEQRLMALTRPQPPNRSPGIPRPPREDMEEPGDEHRDEPRDRPRPHALANERLRESIQRAGSIEGTNTYYYVLYQEDKILAHSAGMPGHVPAPRVRSSDFKHPPIRDALSLPTRQRQERPMHPGFRTRGALREFFRPLPQGQWVLIGRSISTDLAAVHRLAWWLVAAGSTVLVLGLGGGWWLASRAIRPIDDISATAMKIAAGDLSQRINAADTESELGRLAGVLNSTFQRLESSFAQQARFTADASHELRTPVSVIITQTQTALSRERDSLEYRNALQACQRAAQRMRALTESLLVLARLDAGQEAMKRERFNLGQLVQDCVELIQPLAAERGVQLHSELSPVECLGDPERIGQVVTNLLANAIQFNRSQGEVHISVRVENASALLNVADTGEGIPTEDLPYIFERFYRVNKSRTRAQGGTGLGLAICKTIVDAHRGTIEVTSQTGSGSTFTVRLPAAKDL